MPTFDPDPLCLWLRRAGRRLVLLAVFAGMTAMPGILRAQQAPAPLERAVRELGRRVLGGDPAEPNQVTEATEPTEEPEESSEDESLNSDAERVRSLDRVEAFIQRERWHEVVTGLQTLIESPDDTFTRGPQGNWMSLHDAIQRRLESLPETGRRLYEEVYAATAAELLEQARRSGDLDRVADISRRFSNTDAGQQALLQLALLAYDRGELLAAARWFDRLSPEQLASLSAPVSLKYAHALKVEGREQRARELFESAAARSPGEAQLETWWRQVEQPGFLPTPRSDWPQSYGDASHAAAAAGGEPLLSPEWRMPMTFVHSVAGQVESLTQDLRDAGRACLPAMFPVTAGGKAAVRTLRGLQVIDIATGESVWEQKLEEASPERLLSGLAVDAGIANHHRIRVMNGARYGEMGEPDQHPLTNLLYRDAVFGTLATDGEQLFALDQHAVLGRTNSGYLWAQEKEVDPFGRDWTCNRLVSYDLETGRELWRVGGPRRQEPFDLPLAGTYFFGAPTIVGDELFVIGERDSEVSLHVLERRTGRPIYSQPLANSTANIEVDMARRFWACQPAVSQGVVVCPTTAGWVVAVDRTQRRLLWAYGYGGGDTEHRQRRFGGLMVHPLHPLGTRWAWAPPVVVGNRVFITPQELPDAYHSRAPSIVCLDLSTGEELWRRDKEEEGLYMAGATANGVLVVGSSRVRCLSLETGSPQWSVTLPAEAPPSGRGLLVGEQYLLPLANGEVWMIQTRDGGTAATLQMPAGEPPLGNLAISNGALVSVDAQSVRAFADRATLERQIAERRQRDEQDLWAIVRRAELAAMRGETETAVQTLSSADRATLGKEADPALKARWRELLRTSLMELVANNPADSAEHFEQLTALAAGREDISYRRLAVDRALALGNADEAWRHLAALMETPLDARITQGELEVRLDAWLSGRLMDLHASAAESLRETMRARFHELASAAADREALLRLERMFAFHPEGRALTARLAAEAKKAGDIAGAELRLRRLMATEDAAAAAAAAVQLARGLAEAGAAGEAAASLTRLRQQLAADESGEDVLAVIDQAQQELAAKSGADSTQRHDWSGIDFELVPAGKQRDLAQEQEVHVAPGDSPYFEQFRMSFQTQSQRLAFTDLSGLHESWSAPLRTPSRQLFEQSVGVRTDGLQAYVVWQGVVQAISAPDRRVRWAWPIDLRFSASSYLRNAHRTSDEEMRSADAFSARWSVRRHRSPSGMIAAASPDYVLVHGRREVSALDPLTGDLLWTHGDVPPESMVYGDGPRIHILPSGASEPLTLRASDGRIQDGAALAARVHEAIALGEGRVTTLSTPPSVLGFLGLPVSRARLEGINLASGEADWSHEFDGRTLFGWLGARQIAALLPSGRLEAVDAHSGERVALGEIPQDVLATRKTVQVVGDARRIFLLVDDSPGRHISYLDVPSARINGTVLCFSIAERKLLWQRRLADQQLLLPRFPQSPVLVFLSQRSLESVPGLFSIDLEIWDKESGKELLATREMATQAPLYQFEIDLARRLLHFATYNFELQVRPRRVSGAAASVPETSSEGAEVAPDKSDAPAPAPAPQPESEETGASS